MRTRSVLEIEECCSWCRRPASRCTEASCDDARVYSGILLRGEWKEVSEREKGQAQLLPATYGGR